MIASSGWCAHARREHDPAQSIRQQSASRQLSRLRSPSKLLVPNWIFAMLPNSTLQDAEALLAACRAKGIMLATAESCTGGLIAAALTSVAGSSDVVDRGFVTYSNEAKNQMIGVPMKLIETNGAVSEAVARAMAEGTLARSHAAIVVSVTGVAGPGGGSEEKPVGL